MTNLLAEISFPLCTCHATWIFVVELCWFFEYDPILSHLVHSSSSFFVSMLQIDQDLI